jgi:methyltransferase (TIGR00027 family)
MPMVGHHVARARYVEERVEEGLPAGLGQYVLLGAGMDSFALRRPDLAPRLKVFEVDHPGTQAWKRARLKRLDFDEPTNVEYVGVDFETESLADGLRRSGFSRETLSLFAWMGVIPYLTEESIVATLRDLAENAVSGSELVFDTLDRAVFTEGREKPIGRKMFAATAKWGEPLITGYDPPELGALLAEAGLSVVEVKSPAEFTDQWFSERSDGLEPWEHMYVVRARVE